MNQSLLQQKTCKHCQTAISAKAKRCPHCAGDLRSWPARHPVLSIFLFLFVGLPILGGMISSISAVTNRTSTKAPAAATPAPIAVPITTMIASYDENQISADARYKSANVKLSGYVDNISKDILNNPYITINPTAEEHYFGTHVQCFVTEAEAVKTANGKAITVTGKVKGMSLGIIGVDDCKVL